MSIPFSVSMLIVNVLLTSAIPAGDELLSYPLENVDASLLDTIYDGYADSLASFLNGETNVVDIAAMMVMVIIRGQIIW